MNDLVIVACGSRSWIDLVAAQRVAALLPVSTLVVHGDCRGADLTFELAAVRRGLQTHAMVAEWDRFGPAAGPIRNSEMLRVLLDARRRGRAVGVLAFHDDPALGVGTRDMVERSRRSGIGVVVITHLIDCKLHGDCFGMLGPMTGTEGVRG